MPDVMPTFNTQPQPLNNGAIPTYPTQAAPIMASNPLNTYSQVMGTEQAGQNMRNQGQQMKRDQIAFQEQQTASRNHQAGLLQPGTEDFNKYKATGLLPGEQPHQSLIHNIGQALAHGMSAIKGLVHGPDAQGAIPAPASAAAAPSATTQVDAPPPPTTQVPGFEDGGEVPIQKSTTGDLLVQAAKEIYHHFAGANNVGSGAANQAAQKIADRPAQVNQTVDDMSKMNGGPITPNAGIPHPVVAHGKVTPEFMTGPRVGDPPGHHSTIVAYDQGGPVLNEFAMSGATQPRHDTDSGAGGGGGGAGGLSNLVGGVGANVGVGADAGVGAGSGAASGMAGGLSSALAFFQDGGPVPSPAFGVRDGGVSGLKGFAEGGPTDSLQGPPTPVSPQAAQQTYVQTVEQQAAHLHKLALDDSGHRIDNQGVPSTGPVPVPGVNAPDAAPQASPAPVQGPAPGAVPTPPAQAGAPAAPSPAGGGAPSPDQQATAGVLKQAQSDETAIAGEVSTTAAAEGKPHSIASSDWDLSDQLINRAGMAAAAAGHDGSAVIQSLNANRNAWIQGHALRWLSVANTQALNGNSKGVVDAMKNAYYYIPDSQELDIKAGKDGTVMYQDPINPTKADGTPNMVPVDPQHIQMLGTALLDPMNVNNMIIGARSAQAKIALEHSQAQAALMTGEGNLRKGTGIQSSGTAHLQRVSSENWKDLASGQADLIRANAVANHLTNIVKANHIDPQLMRGAQEAGTIFEQTAQGQLTTQPTTTTDPKTGQQVESLSPGAGRPMRDPTKIPPELQGASPADIMDGKAMAQKIFLGSSGTMATAEAARLAALYTQQKRNPKGGPDGKQAGVQTDPKTGDTHVWNPAKKSWEAFKLPILGSSGQPATVGPSTADLDPLARDILARGSSDQRAVPSSSPEADDTPDMEDQKFPAES